MTLSELEQARDDAWRAYEDSEAAYKRLQERKLAYEKVRRDDYDEAWQLTRRLIDAFGRAYRAWWDAAQAEGASDGGTGAGAR